MAETVADSQGASLVAPGGDELLFVPLGGTSEIGLNLYLYGHGGEWLAVDFGIGFADDTMTGADILVPDPGFMFELGSRLRGIVLTHAHEDHIGAIQHFADEIPCPIYATPFTAAVLRRKLDVYGGASSVDVRTVAPGQRFQVGGFDLQLVTMTHSIPEPNALVVRTPAGTVLHSGDWKLDPTPTLGPQADESSLAALGDAGVLALVCDSTNVMQAGESGSEQVVREGLTQVIGRCSGKVAVTCFSTNVARLESIAYAARANNREVALVGRALTLIEDAARATGYMTETPRFLSEAEAGRLPDERIVYICTGSQGESRSALARIADGSHGRVTLDRGDNVIFSSRVIPGNEGGIARMQEKLMRRGVNVIVDDELEALHIHVSGHPARGELERLYALVRPRLAVPIHGEYRHLRAHAQLARECGVEETGIPHNGAVVRLSADGIERLADAPSGILMVDDEQLIPVRGESMKLRRRVLHNGAIFVTVPVGPGPTLSAAPQVATLGLIDDDADTEGEVALDLPGAVEDALERVAGRQGDTADEPAIRQAVEKAVRKRVKAEFAKRPVVIVHVLSANAA